MKAVYMGNDGTDFQNLSYLLVEASIFDSGWEFLCYVSGWAKFDGDYEYGGFSGDKFIMAQGDSNRQPPLKVVIFGKYK